MTRRVARTAFSQSDHNWLAVTAAVPADVFFVAIEKFSEGLVVDLYRILSVVVPAVVDRSFANVCAQGRFIKLTPA